MLERMWSKGNTPPLLMGMQICTTTVEIGMAVFQKIGNQLTARPNNTTQRMLNHTEGHLFNYVYSNIICNSQNLETNVDAPHLKNGTRKWGTFAQ